MINIKKKQKDYKKKNIKKIKTSLNTYMASDLGEIYKKGALEKISEGRCAAITERCRKKSWKRI